MFKKRFSTVFSLSLSIYFGCAQPSFSETLSPLSAIDTPQTNLPHCANSESDLAEIQSIQRANQKTLSKYDGYRNILFESTDIELATRLAYAETLAANCPDQADRILDLTASVIGNRIRKRHGDIKSVVFQKDQFSSSLNIYSESRYRDFLCPKDSVLWKKSVEKMRVNFESSKPSAPIPPDTVNYYLYRHSERFKSPNWKLEETIIADEKTRECIRVFRDPIWK